MKISIWLRCLRYFTEVFCAVKLQEHARKPDAGKLCTKTSRPCPTFNLVKHHIPCLDDPNVLFLHCVHWIRVLQHTKTNKLQIQKCHFYCQTASKKATQTAQSPSHPRATKAPVWTPEPRSFGKPPPVALRFPNGCGVGKQTMHVFDVQDADAVPSTEWMGWFLLTFHHQVCQGDRTSWPNGVVVLLQNPHLRVHGEVTDGKKKGLHLN